MASFLDFNKEIDTSNFNNRDYLLSLPEKERQQFVEDLRRIGMVAPAEDNVFVEFAQGTMQSLVGGMAGAGATLNELGFGSSMEDYFRGVQRRNQQWNAPEDQSMATYIARGIGNATGSVAPILTASAVGTLVSPGVGTAAGLATGFSMTFGDNVQRNREAGYSEEKAYGMGFLESALDTVIENAPWGIVGKGMKGLKNASRLADISKAGKKELLQKIGQKMSAEIGKDNTQNLLLKWGKQAVYSGLGESGEEVLQYINSYVNQKLGGDENAEFSIDELADVIAQGFIGGFSLGGAMGTPKIRHEARMRKEANSMPQNQTTAVQDLDSELLDEEEVAEDNGTGELPGVNTTQTIEETNTPIENTAQTETVLPETQGNFDVEKQSQLVKTLADAFKLKVKFFDEVGINRDDVDGIFDEGTEETYINRYSPNNLNFLFGHEFKHFINVKHTDLAVAFDNLIKKNLNKEGQTELQNQGGDFAEFSADAFGRMIMDPKVLNETAKRLEAQEKGLGEKVLYAVKDFIAALKKRLKNIDTPEAKQLFDNISEVQKLTVDILAEIHRRNGNSTEVENVVGANGNTQVETVPVKNIKVDAERFQFKSNTNKSSGVDESNKLGGNWDARTAGNLYLWEDKNGNLFVVNGHHRLELAQRNGVDTVNAIIDRESDGVSAEQARRNGVLINIRDGQGDVRDYASFVRSENLSEKEVEDAGVTARAKGRAGYLLGKSGDTLYDAYRNNVVSEKQAVIIAEIAKGNEAIEYAGIKLAKDRKLAGETLRQTLKLAAQSAGKSKSKGEQDSLFDMADDSVLQEWESIGKAAATRIKEIKTRIDAAKDAIKNPKAAQSLGVKTTKGAEKLLAKAQEDLARWENYATDPELMAQLRNELGIATDNNRTEQKVTDNEVKDKNDNVPDLELDKLLSDMQSPIEKLAKTLKNKYQGIPVEVDELIQEGLLGVQDSYNKGNFDSSKGASEVTYYSRAAQNFMLRLLEQNAKEQKTKVSINDEIGEDLKIEDTIADSNDITFENTDSINNLFNWIKTLPKREQKMLKMKEQGATYEEIGKAVGLNKSRVGEILKELKSQAEAKIKYHKRNKKQVDTPQFKAWFKDSKVVDENGNPLVVYHGTDRYGFTVFRDDSHFTADYDYAKRYTNKRHKDTESGVYAVYLSIQNPFDIRNPDDRKIFTEYRQGHIPAETKTGAMDWAEYDYEDFREYLQENYPQKYDGIILDEGGDADNAHRGIAYVPFYPTQIKSATDNVGTFDKNNPDIRYHKRKHQQVNPIVQDGKVRDDYQDLLENKEYTPETIEQWDKKAIDWIDKLGGVSNAIEAFVGDIRHSDRHVNTLIVRHLLESNVADTMQTDDLVKLEEAYIEEGTAWGREGVARRLASLTLDRIERVQALFNKLHENMDNEKLQKLRRKIMDKLGIDILSLDKSILDDKDKLDAVLREEQAAQADKYDKAYEFWINSILSAPSTHIVNTVGNLANIGYEYSLKRFGEAALNLAFKKKDAASFGEFKQIWKNMDVVSAWEKSKVALNREMLTPQNKFRETSDLAIGGKTGRIIRIPTRFLTFMDEFAKNLIIPMEVSAQAYRSGIAQGLKGKALQEYIDGKLNSTNSKEYRIAEDKARELTFKKEPAKAIQYLIAMKNEGGLMGNVLKYTLPFMTTPYNILAQGVRRSPLGTLYLAGRTAQNIAGEGKFDSNYIGLVAEQLIAWGTLMLLNGLSDDDDLPLITGSSEKYGTAEQRYKEQNIPPYSVRIGNTYVSYKRIEPLATMLSIIADTMQTYKDGKDGRNFKKNFTKMSRSLTEKTYLKSLDEILQWFEDPERSIGSIGTNFLASWMPNAAKSLIMSADDEVRNNKSYERGADWWADQSHVVTSKAGFTRRLPKIDPFGNEITKENAENANPAWLYIGRIVGQYTKRIDEKDKVKKLILNYNLKVNPDEPYWPDIPRNTFVNKGEKYYFGNKDYHDFCVESGKLAKKQLYNAVKHGLLNIDNPTEKDIKLMKQVFTRARKEVKEQFIKQKRYNKQK